LPIKTKCLNLGRSRHIVLIEEGSFARLEMSAFFWCFPGGKPIMRRVAILPSIVLGISVVLVGIDQIAPRLTKRVGLDFWNLGNLSRCLKDEDTRYRRLDREHEQGFMRREEVDRIALAVCERRMALAEAIELMIPIAQSHTAWSIRLQIDSEFRDISASGDRDLAIYYLWANIQGMLETANAVGDEIHAATIAKRLAHLEIEIREQKNFSVRMVP
jgi:hypothetical protein